MLVIVPGYGGHFLAWHLAEWRNPEPGRLAGVAPRLQLHCTGSGSPTVILEAGLGDLLSSWRRVQPPVAMFTRVCSYDRAGYGNSESGEFPRTSKQIARELHATLAAADERPPYLLVGHSAGGYHVRAFHGLYGKEVVGMVLVDSIQEDQYERIPRSMSGQIDILTRRYERQARWAWIEVDSGYLRLRYALAGVTLPHLLLQSRYFRARASEVAMAQTSAGQARAAGSLGDKPLIVITGARAADAALREAIGASDAKEFTRIWIYDLQPRLAALSSRGRQIILADSGHDVPADRPDAIVTAIREVRDTAQSR